MNTAQPGTTRVGFIGLGLMGKPMAENILRAGYELTIYNRTAAKATSLVDQGANGSASPAEAAASADVVVTMVTDTPDVVDVLTRPDGVLAGARSGSVWIDMSTINPETTRDLGERAGRNGVRSVDAPVSGGPPGAASGTLSIMAGGDPEAFQAVRPLLETMGKTITYMGALGAGQMTKACNQIVVAAYLTGIAEALVFGAKGGVDPALIREALLGGYAQSRMLEVHGERMVKRAFEPGFFVKLHDKDLHIVLEAARAMGVATPLAAMAAQHFNSLLAHGEGELDNSAMLKVYERLADRELPSAGG
jgi:2-hydroxy-3-oxopropionate reductase